VQISRCFSTLLDTFYFYRFVSGAGTTYHWQIGYPPSQLQLTYFQSTHLDFNKQKPHEINYKQIAPLRSNYVPAILMVCVVLFSEFANAVPRKKKTCLKSVEN